MIPVAAAIAAMTAVASGSAAWAVWGQRLRAIDRRVAELGEDLSAMGDRIATLERWRHREQGAAQAIARQDSARFAATETQRCE